MRFVVEADSIATDRMSGIGHATLEIIRELLHQKSPRDQIVLVVPFGKKSLLDKYHLHGATVRSLLPGYRYINRLLVRTSLPLPIDLFFGRGYYIFPNYKNWYVPFSFSLTFVHDVAYKVFPDTIHPKNLVYLNANMERWLKRTTKVATISRASAEEIEKFFPRYKEKIVLVPLGVDQTTFHPSSPKEVEAAKQAVGVDGDYFIYVGNIEPRKNIMTLLDAYKTYSDVVESPAQLLLIGGGGWKNEAIHQRIGELQRDGYGVIVPSMYVEDSALPALYSGANALVHVSLHEGFGLSVVQAQACGAPVILSDIAVLREISEPMNRILVDPHDVAGIADALQLFGAKKKTNKNPEIRYTWAKTVQKIIEIAAIVGDKNAR